MAAMNNKRRSRRTAKSRASSKSKPECGGSARYDFDPKDVLPLADEQDRQQPPAPEVSEKIMTLPATPLQELIGLMRRSGFWLNPNLRPDFPDLRGNFTNFLPHLARCRMLVQCNPDKTGDEVHHWMWWPGDGSARVRAVWHVPIVGDAAFLDLETDAGNRWWRHLRQIIHDTVELKPEQRWLRFYRITVSFDGRHERLLRVVHLGCHALTACAFFLAPNGLRPERIADFGRTT